MAQLRETVRATFAHYDADGSGAIDARELRSLVADLGGYLTDKELAAALRALDRDADGVIDEREFAAWWTAQSGDLDGDGQVGELERAMERVKASGQDRFRVDIHSAAWRGAREAVERLLSDDAELVHEVDATEYGRGNTALHYAAYQGHADVCALLITGGAKVNSVNASGCSPLFLAAQQSRLAVVALLLEHGADIRLAEKEHQLTAVDVCSSDEILACFRARAGGVSCVPDAPQVVDALDTTVSIEWTTPRDKHDQIAPISGYKIRAVPVDASATPPRVLLVGALPTQHTIDGLAPDTAYRIQLAAINLHGISAFSAPSEPTRTRPARPPPPSNARARALDAASIEITWEVPSAFSMSHFVVQQCVDALGDLWKLIGRVATEDLDSGICRFVAANLLDAHRYRFRVAAVSAGAGQSDFCAPVEARTRAASDADAKLTPRAAASDRSQIKPRVAVRDVVGVVNKLRLEAKRGSPAVKYPSPQEAVAPRQSKTSEVLRARVRGVSSVVTVSRDDAKAAAQDELRTGTATAIAETKQPKRTARDRIAPSRNRPYHEPFAAPESDQHGQEGGATSEEEDEYVHFSNSEDEEDQDDER